MEFLIVAILAFILLLLGFLVLNQKQLRFKDAEITTKETENITKGKTLEETLAVMIKNVNNHGQVVMTSNKQFPWIAKEIIFSLGFHFDKVTLLRPEIFDNTGSNLYEFKKLSPKGEIKCYLAVYYNIENIEDYDLSNFQEYTNSSIINIAHKVVFVYPEADIEEENIKLEWFNEALKECVVRPRMQAADNSHYELSREGLVSVPNIGYNIPDDLAVKSYFIEMRTSKVQIGVHPVRALQRILQHAGGILPPVSFLMGKEYRNGKTYFLRWILSILEGSPSVNIIRLTPENIKYLEKHKNLLIRQYANQQVVNVFYAERIDEMAATHLGLLCDLMEGTLHKMLNSMCLFPYNELTPTQYTALSGPGRAVEIIFNKLNYKQAQNLITFLLNTEKYGTNGIEYEYMLKNKDKEYTLGEIYGLLQPKYVNEEEILNSFVSAGKPIDIPSPPPPKENKKELKTEEIEIPPVL